jgi:hypothetical protein
MPSPTVSTESANTPGVDMIVSARTANYGITKPVSKSTCEDRRPPACAPLLTELQREPDHMHSPAVRDSELAPFEAHRV